MSETTKRPFEQDGEPRIDSQTTPYGSGDTTRPTGIESENMLKPGGFGVEQGRPYGTLLRNERTERDAALKFLPTWRSRLGAATRRALGR